MRMALVIALGLGAMVGACRRDAPRPARAEDPQFAARWQQLSAEDVEVFYIEDDRGDGLMGRVRRARTSSKKAPVPAAAPLPAAEAPVKPEDLPVPSGEAVASAIHDNLASVKTCYLRLARQGPVPSGKAIVSFTIDAGGAVQNPQVAAPAFTETSLPACVLSVIRHWQFPKSKVGGLAVSYPFVFVGA